jgi:hypothetical protein
MVIPRQGWLRARSARETRAAIELFWLCAGVMSHDGYAADREGKIFQVTLRVIVVENPAPGY